MVWCLIPYALVPNSYYLDFVQFLRYPDTRCLDDVINIYYLNTFNCPRVELRKQRLEERGFMPQSHAKYP